MVKFIDGEDYVFVSYSSKDREKVVNTLQTLNEKYKVNIWYDANLIAGNTWTDEAISKMISSTAVLFFGSVNALTSPNVLEEVRYIKDCYPKHPFIPISFENRHFSEIIKFDVNPKSSGYPDEQRNAANKMLPYLNNNITRIILDRENPIVSIDNLYNAIFNLASSAILGDKKTEIKNNNIYNDVTITKGNDQIITNDKVKTSDAKKTENLKYTLYGKSYSDNQSDFMFTVFKEVLSKKPSAIKEVINQLTCATEVDFTLPENRNSGKMKPYFRTCKYFTFSDREGVCIGTSYSFNDKLIMVAKLLKICGENNDVLKLENVSLPTVKVVQVHEEQRNSDSGMEYVLFGKTFKGNQSEMMSNIFEKVISKHPDKLEELSSKLTCISLVDYDLQENRESMKPYFRARKMFYIDGKKYCVGTSYGLKDKLVLIRKLFTICGEPSSELKIRGQVF